MSKNTKTQTIKWPGESGKTYEYGIYPIGTHFPKKGGNYIFAKKNARGYWVPVYIGQSSSLDSRLPKTWLSNVHEKAQCAKRNGATHIHAHVNTYVSARLVEEKDLIEKWNPPCNEQLTTN